jgi:hypothetical protein
MLSPPVTALSPVGVGVASVTVVLADTGAPPLLLQASAYVVAAEIGPTCWVPEVAREPLHPFEAVQVVAFVEDQLSVTVPPGPTVFGVADSVTVGVATGGGLLPPPPPPPQLATKIAHAMTESRASVRVMIDSILTGDIARHQYHQAQDARQKRPVYGTIKRSTRRNDVSKG